MHSPPRRKRSSTQTRLFPIADSTERQYTVSLPMLTAQARHGPRPTIFEVPAGVEDLVFSWPLLRQLPDLAPLARLRSLVVSGVRGTVVFPDLALNTALEEVVLSQIDMCAVPPALAAAPGLTTLRIEWCLSMACIDAFVTAAAAAQTLTTLEVGDTPLLLERVLEIASLRRLVVHSAHHEAQVLPQMTPEAGLVHLSIRDVECPQGMLARKLECANARLKILTLDGGSVPGLAGFSNLFGLYLHDTDIERLDDGIGTLAQLRIVDLRNNVFLTTLPKSLGRLVGLEKLAVVGASETWAVCPEPSELAMCVAFFLQVGAFPALRELALGKLGPFEARALSDVIRKRFASREEVPYAAMRSIEIAGSFAETFADGTGVARPEGSLRDEASLRPGWAMAVLARMRGLRRMYAMMRGCAPAAPLMDNGDAQVRLREHLFGVAGFEQNYRLGPEAYPLRFAEHIEREHAQLGVAGAAADDVEWGGPEWGASEDEWALAAH